MLQPQTAFVAIVRFSLFCCLYNNSRRRGEYSLGYITDRSGSHTVSYVVESTGHVVNHSMMKMMT